jgi:DNA-directed RNA polymerase specialized sigma24 family protein
MLVPEDTPKTPAAGPSPGPAFTDKTLPWQAASDFAVAQALGLVGHRRRQLGEDIAQEALMRMWRQKPEIRTTWQALLSTIVLRLAWNHLRDERTRRGHVCIDMEAMQGARDGEPAPPEQLIQAEVSAELAVLLSQLDDRFGRGTRAIVVFRARGVPWDEIVGIVDLAVRTCSYRYQWAIEWLQERLSLQETRGGHHD